MEEIRKENLKDELENILGYSIGAKLFVSQINDSKKYELIHYNGWEDSDLLVDTQKLYDLFSTKLKEEREKTIKDILELLSNEILFTGKIDIVEKDCHIFPISIIKQIEGLKTKTI